MSKFTRGSKSLIVRRIDCEWPPFTRGKVVSLRKSNDTLGQTTSLRVNVVQVRKEEKTIIIIRHRLTCCIKPETRSPGRRYLR